jgi:hypothetical protein
MVPFYELSLFELLDLVLGAARKQNSEMFWAICKFPVNRKC